MTALVYAIISGPEHGWTSGRVLATAAVAVVVLAAFASWESRITYPMLDPHFFRDRRFTGAVAGVVLITFGMGGALFLLTQHLQFVLGYDALEAGLRTAPSRWSSSRSTSPASRRSGRRSSERRCRSRWAWC